MSIRIAINGFGRIGRAIVRALYEGGYRDHVTLVAINDVCCPETNAHLLKYDSVHGQFNQSVCCTSGTLQIADDEVRLLVSKQVSDLPWRELQVDVVLECTGHHARRQLAAEHIAAGAPRVLVSAPVVDADETVVFGVNEQVLRPGLEVVSNASCTTNCLAPVVDVLHRQFSIESGLMTTIHSYTNDQSLVDAVRDDPYRARAAALSMIPTRTGAAAALGLVLPELDGRFDGMAVRVPTANVSLIDLSLVLASAVDVAAINAAMKDAAQRSKVLDYNELPLVSVDFNHRSASAIFDAAHTRVQGPLVKVMAWYDNEWGFANRMLDTASAWVQAG